MHTEDCVFIVLNVVVFSPNFLFRERSVFLSYFLPFLNGVCELCKIKVNVFTESRLIIVSFFQVRTRVTVIYHKRIGKIIIKLIDSF